jgi:hypothetical protein
MGTSYDGSAVVESSATRGLYGQFFSATGAATGFGAAPGAGL